MIFPKIKDNSIIIVPNNLKIKLLKILSNFSLKNIKIITLNELKNKLYFSYDDRAIYYLMKKYNYKIDVAKMYLDRLYEIEESTLTNPKITKIKELKEELEKEELLIKTPNFKKYLETKSIILYNCQNLSKLDKKIISTITTSFKIEKLTEEPINYPKSGIYEFETIEEEVIYTANKILDLKNKNISFNNIKICFQSSEYNNIVRRIFKWYNIPINIDDNYLYSTKIVSDFITNLETKEKGLEHIEKNYDLTNEKNKNIYNKIIEILNNYLWCSDIEILKEFLIDKFKSTSINIKHYQEEVEIINDLNLVAEDDFIFLMGFNQGEIPKTYKDEDYFNDFLKQELGLDTTKDLNENTYLTWLQAIKQTKNLTITYKLNSSLGVHYLSSLNEDLNLNILYEKNTYKYSNLHNKLLLGEKIDDYIKFGTKDIELNKLYNTYPDILYRTYNNNYTNIDKTLLQKYLNNKLVLSYSAMNTYYQCSFRYYLQNILKLNIYEETFYTIIGNLFHYILSIVFSKDINIDEEYDNYLSKLSYNFNSREKFFLSILKPELNFIIETIKKQNTYNSLTKTYYEEKIEVEKSTFDTDIKFKGFIDKLYTSTNEDIISIVDYKTGNPDLNLNNIIYGLDMQLPVYIYLAKKRFENSKVVGFYLQKILNNEITKDANKEYLTLKEDKLKLQGYSNSNTNILELFDSSYQESKVIKGMKTSSKGISSKKVFNDELIEKINDLTEEKIDEAISNILKGEFSINPKRVGMNNLGCKYCSFKDICFMNEANIENLKEYKNLEFLGGEDNDTEEA